MDYQNYSMDERLRGLDCDDACGRDDYKYLNFSTEKFD